MTAPARQAADSAPPAPEPFYLDGEAGSLFCLRFLPAAGQAPRGALLYLPPFAEEANRSRRMAVLQAGRLAARGWAVLLLDPFGTGDSAGSFHEARWAIWRADAARAADWLAARFPGLAVVPWGLRLGALLAVDLAARHPDRFQRLLLWQPVLKGDQFMSQFLRLRVAAAMAAGEKETGQALRGRLAAGELLEVAGYELAPELVAAIDGLRLEALLATLADCRIDWLEVSTAGDEPALGPATRRLMEALADTAAPQPAAPQPAGPQLVSRAIPGEPFWTIQEITLAPRLLDATDALFA